MRKESWDKNLFHRIYKIELWSVHSGCSSVLSAFKQEAKVGSSRRKAVKGRSPRPGSECLPPALPVQRTAMYLVLCGSLLSLLSLYSGRKWVAHFPRSPGMLSAVTWLAAFAGYRFPWRSWGGQKGEVRKKEAVSVALTTANEETIFSYFSSGCLA